MTNFIELYDELYGPLLGIRSPTFRAVLKEAQQRLVHTIVETGCIRSKDNWKGDGQSTVIWNHFIKVKGGTFCTIDINLDAVILAQNLCPETDCLCGDSVETLNKYKGSIDLLYLDSSHRIDTNAHPAALQCLFEFLAARQRLTSGSIIFIDDSPITDSGEILGKGLYIAQYMKRLNIYPFTTGYQAAWILP